MYANLLGGGVVLCYLLISGKECIFIFISYFYFSMRVIYLFRSFDNLLDTHVINFLGPTRGANFFPTFCLALLIIGSPTPEKLHVTSYTLNKYVK